MIDFSQSSSAEFLQALQAGTSGLWALEAGVWLLEHHGVWLQDPRLRPYVDGGVQEDGTVWAGFDVKRVDAAIDAGALGEWGEDIAVLCFILSLCGDYPISLRYNCENLSKETLGLMSKALFLANGYEEPRSLDG
ncbi:hypothetical protein AMK16_32735 [Streptomyces sp. CB00455]|uniref:hypothetical protein n=1 Tax=Streptomyces sp. CB00455 TaxID=1703927 RepID=UPI00094024DB|nr:hypothetical protein [Streptomyces sp. CB00455]OKK11341.1 hypothetical protein AMK16_32735 [Streptomyces sp. CB00455]